MNDARRRWMSGIAVVVAGAAAFVVGSSLTPDPVERSAGSVTIGAPAVGSDEVPPAGEATAETSTSTTQTATTTTDPPRPLANSVSGWDSTITWATEGSSAPVLVRLLADAAAPEEFELPRSAGQFAWNSAATLVAYVDDRVLYVGPPGEAEPLAVEVQQLQWHETDANRIVWTTIEGDLRSSVPTFTTAFLSEVGGLLEAGNPFALPDEVADGELKFWSLLVWSDAGFLVGRQTVTDAEGDDEARADLMVMSGDGELVRLVEGQGVHVGDGVVVVNPPADDLSPGRLLAVAVDGQQRPISLNPGAELIAVGSGGESWLAIGPGDTMTAVDGERILQIPIEIVAAAWSTDGQSLVVAGSSGELGVIDMATGQVVGTTNAADGGALWNLRVHAGAGRE